MEILQISDILKRKISDHITDKELAYEKYDELSTKYDILERKYTMNNSILNTLEINNIEYLKIYDNKIQYNNECISQNIFAIELMNERIQSLENDINNIGMHIGYLKDTYDKRVKKLNNIYLKIEKIKQMLCYNYSYNTLQDDVLLLEEEETEEEELELTYYQEQTHYQSTFDYDYELLDIYETNIEEEEENIYVNQTGKALFVKKEIERYLVKLKPTIVFILLLIIYTWVCT